MPNNDTSSAGAPQKQLGETLPFISIVMPSFNQKRFIRKSIDSVLSQNYPQIEIIVIDGGSTDGTAAVLKEFGNRIRWISEKDRGQADALNKGFCIASGSILGWLNSDDLYEKNALFSAGHFFAKHPEIMWAFGHCTIIDEQGSQIRRWISDYKSMRLRRYSYKALLTENFISQMGVFIQKEAFDQIGGLDYSLHYAMDYDLWLQLGKKFEPGFIDRKIGKFRMYTTSKSMTGFQTQFLEDFRVAKKYAEGHVWFIFCHKINQIKIISVYHCFNFFRLFSKAIKLRIFK